MLEEPKQVAVLEWRERRKSSGRLGGVVTGVRAKSCLASICGISESLRAGIHGHWMGRKVGSGRVFFFFLLSLLVGEKAKVDGLGLRGAGPECSREGLAHPTDLADFNHSNQ